MRLLLALAALLLLPAGLFAQQTVSPGVSATAAPNAANNNLGETPSPHPRAGLPSTQYALNLKGVLPNYGKPLNNGTYTPLADGPYSVQFRLYTVSDRANPAPPVYLETDTVSILSLLPRSVASNTKSSDPT